MPNISNASVITGSGYGFSNIKNTKAIIVDKNGDYYIATSNSSFFKIMKSVRGIGAWTEFFSYSKPTDTDSVYTLETDGDYIYFAFAATRGSVQLRTFNLNGTLIDTKDLRTGMNYPRSISMSFNGNKTNLHVAAVYQTSSGSASNLYYFKGSIANGIYTSINNDVITTLNNSLSEIRSGIIFVKNDTPYVLCNAQGNDAGIAAGAYVLVLSPDLAGKDPITSSFIKSDWGVKRLYFKTNRTVYQTDISAVLVENGTSDGRIYFAWRSYQQSPDTYKVAHSYTDDFFGTINPVQIYTPTTSVDITTVDVGTIEKTGFYIYMTNSENRSYAYNGNTVSLLNENSGSIVGLKNSNVKTTGPTYAYNNTLSNSLGVYFSGSWDSQSISPKEGDRGRILSRQNILTYNITNDSPIGTVTEKINGVTVGTKSLNSGQNTTINITQAQWDTIPYGKYQNNNAARNTIEIVTSAGTYKYTFEKWIDNTADILSSIKAVKDSKDYYLPSAKKILSDAINSKGGSTTPTDSVESMANSITMNIGTAKHIKGTTVSSTSSMSFQSNGSGTTNSYYVEIDTDSIGFVPKTVVLWLSAQSASYVVVANSIPYFKNGNFQANTFGFYNAGSVTRQINYKIENGIMYIPVIESGQSHDFEAYTY